MNPTVYAIKQAPQVTVRPILQSFRQKESFAKNKNSSYLYNRI